MRIKLLIFLFIGAFGYSYGQNGCPVSIYESIKPSEEQSFWAEQERIVAEYNSGKSKAGNTLEPILIPLVFHIIGDNTISEVSPNDYQKVRENIIQLNNDFRRKFGTNSYGTGVDMGIEFCLANVDPEGNFTTGIIEHRDPATPYPKWKFDNSVVNNNDGTKVIISIDQWDPDSYLNVYIVELEASQTAVAWVGIFPWDRSSFPYMDGIVVNKKYIGNNPFETQFNLGKSLTHEVGHWSGLKHVWGDGDCNVDDGVYDTPICSGNIGGKVASGCASGTACITQNLNAGILNYYRPTENYMDYSDDDCLNAFTLGQRNVFRAHLNTYRSHIKTVGSTLVPCSFPEHCTNGVQDEDELGIDCGGFDCVPCLTTSAGGNTGSGCSHTLADGFLLNDRSAPFVIACDEDISFKKYDNDCKLWFPGYHLSLDDDECESSGPNLGSSCYDEDCWRHAILVDIAEVGRTLVDVTNQKTDWIKPITDAACGYYPQYKYNEIKDFTDGIGGYNLEPGKFYRFMVGGNYKNAITHVVKWEVNTEFFYILPSETSHINEELESAIYQLTTSVSVTNSIFTETSSTEYIASEFVEFKPNSTVERGAFMDLKVAPISCASQSENKRKVDDNSYLANNIDKQIDLFPNPATHGVTFDTDLVIRKVQLISLNGSLQHFTQIGNYIKLDKVNSGVYVMKFITDEKVYHKKLIVH